MTVTEKLLLGAGPSPVPDPVLAALSRPTIGHLDPEFGKLMEETCERLRSLFQTTNPATLPLPTTGSGGMEALVNNFIEPDDKVVVGVNGLFGERMAEALARRGADLVRVEAPWGRALNTEELTAAITKGVAAVVVVQGETSTGVYQDLTELSELCKNSETLLMVDCVTSLGGQYLAVDQQGIDVAFSGTQKCLNCPPGLAPFTASKRALEKLKLRSNKPADWYLDLSLLLDYWQPSTVAGEKSARVYHHTAPVNMIYALHEALSLALEEPLEQRWALHRAAHEALYRALESLGFKRLAPGSEVLYPLLAARVPDTINEAEVRLRLLSKQRIEVSGGLGPLAGKIWRIGVMGVGASYRYQQRLIKALCAELGIKSSEPLDELARGWS